MLIMSRVKTYILLSKLCISLSPVILKSVIESQSKDMYCLFGLSCSFVLRTVSSYFNDKKNQLVKECAINKSIMYYKEQRNKYCKVTNYNAAFIRSLERSRNAHKVLYTLKYTHIYPLFVEFGITTSLMIYNIGYQHSLLSTLIVGSYIASSIYIAKKRVSIRQKCNTDEDNLFNNNDNSQIENLKTNEIQYNKTLLHLNITQQCIILIGMLVQTFIWYYDEHSTLSNFVYLFMSQQQLFAPLNQVGMVCREYFQARADILI